MKPFAHPTHVIGRGHRLPETLLLLDERNRLLCRARSFFPGMSDRAAAHHIRERLERYEGGRWRRDRAEAVCPTQHRSTLIEVFYLLLRVRDVVPGVATIRRAFREPRDVERSGD